MWRSLITTKDFIGAVTSYVKSNSDTFDKILDKAFRQRGGRYENSKTILKAFVESDHEDLTSTELYGFIKQSHKKYPRGNLSAYLKRLTTPEYFEVLRYDRNAGKYSFSNPFLSAYAKMKFALDRHKSQKKDLSLSPDPSYIDAEFIEIYIKLLEERSRRIIHELPASMRRELEAS